MLSFLRQRMMPSLLVAIAACATAAAQSPSRTTPAQQDATRPPGTEQNQTVPQQARPVTPDPTAPPGANRPATQTTQPSGVNTQSLPDNSSNVPSPANGGESSESSSSILQPRDMPPMPSLKRVGVTTDDTLTLTLKEAVRRALENNNDIDVARDEVRLAETTLRALEGVYEPVLNLTPQLTSSVSPQPTSLGGSNQSGTVKQTDLEFSPAVIKYFRTGGGQYQFFFNNLRRSTSSTFSEFTPFYSSSLGVQFTQPLLRNRAIDLRRNNIRIQRKRVEQSDADFRRQTTNIISQVQNAYWELVFALRDQQNRILSLKLSRENFRQTEQRITAGSVAPLERAEVQTELARRESDALASANSVSVAENNLKQLILHDTLAKEWSAQIIPLDEPTFDVLPVNLNDSLEEARVNRPELRRLHMQREINDLDQKYYKNQTKPQVDLQATVAATGLAGTPVPSTTSLDGTGSATDTVPQRFVGGYGQMLRNLVKLDTHNVVVGVSIQLPLHNKTAKANLAYVNIQRGQLESSIRSQELLVEAEVRNAVQLVETLRQQVISARTARVNAEQQLAGERGLFQVGRTTTFLLFQRENEVSNTRSLELRAQIDYNKALANLQRVTSTTLRANSVFVETRLP
jgi:HAE1 family hydrophobic/amphiphilic exporter-1